MLFGKVCKLIEDSIEKQVAHRQLLVSVKSFDSKSWFIAAHKLFFKYDLPECCNVAKAPPSKAQLEVSRQ